MTIKIEPFAQSLLRQPYYTVTMLWLIVPIVIAIVGAGVTMVKPKPHDEPIIDKHREAIMERIRKIGVAPDDLRNLRH